MFSVTTYHQKLRILIVEYLKGLSWARCCLYYISMISITSPMSYLFASLPMTLTYSSKQTTLILYRLQLLIERMSRLVNWLNSNRLALNVSKTNFVIFSAKNKHLKPVTIIINRQAIQQKDYVKYLRVLIDSKLSFKQHITVITKKISRAIGLLYKLRHYVTRKVLIIMYYSLIYPFLIYALPMGQLILFISTAFISYKRKLLD